MANRDDSQTSEATDMLSENPIGGPYEFEGYPDEEFQALASEHMFAAPPESLAGNLVGVGRAGSNAHGTWGWLSTWNGKTWDSRGRTLEPRPGAGKGPIPIGRYSFTRWMSPKLGKTLRLYNVPGFSDILIHVGNTQGDTVGCILAGRQVDNSSKPTRLVDSRRIVDWLYDNYPSGTIWVAS